MNQTTNESSGSAPSPEAQTTATLPDVLNVRTTEELSQVLTTIERHASDLVASPIVREGYMAHGHPAQLGFQHLNTMTSSRIKKHFPLAVKTEPLFGILWAKGKLIVGEELVNKYTARKEGRTYDYTKAINERFAKMFAELDSYRSVLARLEHE